MIQRCTGVDEGLRDQTPLNYGHVSCLLLRQRTARPSVPVEIAEVGHRRAHCRYNSAQ